MYQYISVMHNIVCLIFRLGKEEKVKLISFWSFSYQFSSIYAATLKYFDFYYVLYTWWLQFLWSFFQSEPQIIYAQTRDYSLKTFILVLKSREIFTVTFYSIRE